ncbi:hypothetical protein HHI36_015163 [Cryptolaemus montrouzieri]|uniref:Reverse transcriptase domain-containing protein n=1 Tax=Cryptolaemus montrouzieri TaxID=559131 RepID=A0ABD2N577_9CUCU
MNEKFLYGRSQIVGYKEFLFRVHRAVPSDVPQGSHLGPLLFNLFINDVSSLLNTKFLLFADDMKIYPVILVDSDKTYSQDQMECFSQLASSNSLSLNVEKCRVVTFHRLSSPLIGNYKLNDRMLNSESMVRDLGITLGSISKNIFVA